MSPTALLQSQTQALLTLLNLNQPTPASGSSTDPYPRPHSPAAFDEAPAGPLVWKVLILDELSKDVLATSLRVQDLREQGVTLHLSVSSMQPALMRSLQPGNCMHHAHRWPMSQPCTLSRPHSTIYAESPRQVCLVGTVGRRTDLAGLKSPTLLVIPSVIHVFASSVFARRARISHSRQ